MPDADARFGFRPWVRRAGLSIVLVSCAACAALAAAVLFVPEARYGWFGEPFVWIYIGTLLAGGLKVWLGTRHPVAELGRGRLVVRPLHQFRTRSVAWPDVRGTEQMVGGDRLIVYFDTARGMRFVALNLNLVKNRREFLRLLDERLLSMGFVEKVVDRSRYLTRV
jgi:hypothetical protein